MYHGFDRYPFGKCGLQFVYRREIREEVCHLDLGHKSQSFDPEAPILAECVGPDPFLSPEIPWPADPWNSILPLQGSDDQQQSGIDVKMMM